MEFRLDYHQAFLLYLIPYLPYTTWRSHENNEENEISRKYELEHRSKDLFIWALGETAITEFTKTFRDNALNKTGIFQLY